MRSTPTVPRAFLQALCRSKPQHTSLNIAYRNSSSTTATTTKKPGPLTGITVVSLEQAIAAPFCTRQLADLGARVIKIERPGAGDFARNYDTRTKGLASHFVWVNRSKESLALDLKSPRDHSILVKLLSKADVLVQNLAPGASERLGLGYASLSQKHPGLIVCDISGYGQDGPYRDKKAYDLLIQAEAGLLSVTGTGPNQPAKVGISIADIAAGMYAYSQILAALLQRSQTDGKKGCRIDVSMLECMVEWMGFPMYYAYDGQTAPVPTGASHATIYPYGPFATADGSVMLGIQNEREWANFCVELLSDVSLATDPRFASTSLRVQNRAELQAIIDAALAKLTTEETIAKLERAAIANARVNDLQGVWDHPQLRARRRWTEVDTPTGPLPALIPPGFAIAGAENAFEANVAPIPAVGEHNEAILQELGIGE
jgi:crotonobetainyl-CoA:carnitine CoA-transferase CaiB-like acyl-CoA transferase